MKTMGRAVCVAVLALCLSATAAAGEKIGEITYLEGSVNLLRDGGAVGADDLGGGTPIRNYDVMKTGTDGLAEIEIKPAKGPSLNVKVSPKTSFTFEMNKIGDRQAGTVGLIAGSVSLKVAKLTGSKEVKVKTDSAVMGLRGTDFTVTVPPGSADLLVTCGDGEVVCADGEGTEVASVVPGRAAEKKAGQDWRLVPVGVSDLETFRARWIAERIEALKANALQATRSYAARYEKLLAQFREESDDLASKASVLSKWKQEDRKGQIGGRMEMMREKKEIIGPLFRIRGTLFLFERVYFRLVELSDYNTQGWGKGSISAGVSSDQFFQKMAKDRKDLESRMADVRYVTKMYADRNEGSAPTDSFGEGETDEEDFFSSGF
jgi:hypothetical protein